MENTILDAALSHGIWAVIAVFLLIYIIRSNDQRDARQEENEKSYQAMLNDLTGKYDLLERVCQRVTGEVKGINRVLYDVTGMLSAFIEWE